MDERTSKHLSDRDLRALSTKELLDQIQQDIAELDQLHRKRRPDREPKAKHKTIREALGPLPNEEPEEVPGPFHAVACCNHAMGEFLPIARVRCPFCGEWHRAGDFPKVS